MKNCVALLLILPLVACTTQRYGRQTNLAQVEVQEFTCRDIRIETAKSREFLRSVQDQRSGVSAAHVLGFLGDFGIGNVMEGNAAEESGEMRLRELQTLAVQRNCSGQVADLPSR